MQTGEPGNKPPTFHSADDLPNLLSYSHPKEKCNKLCFGNTSTKRADEVMMRCGDENPGAQNHQLVATNGKNQEAKDTRMLCEKHS